MFESLFETAVLLVSGLFLGGILTWLNYRGIIKEKDGKIEGLINSESGKDKQLDDLRKDIQKRETEKGKISAELIEKENAISSLTQELDNSQEKLNTLNKQINEKKHNISTLENQVSQLITQKNDISIKAEISESRAENSEKVNQTLEETIKKKNQEIDQLKSRIRSMNDDFTILEGIGKKVSTILRLANINTFTKLANTDVGKIDKILEAEDPRILRLTNSATWPEQAKLASEYNWTALEALKQRIKNEKKN